MTRELIIENAQARFKQNFGTPVCDSCEGLKAGPGVTATCFQVRQCFFTNIKTTDVTPKQAKVIDALTKGSNRP